MSILNRIIAPSFSSPSLRAAILDGMYFSLMIGLGEAYLGAFGIFLNGSSFQIGLLSTFPPLIGAASQIVGLYLFEQGIPRKQLIIFAAVLQALIWALIALIPFIFPIAASTVWALLGCAILHQVFGSIAVPSWNTLIGDLVPEEMRGRYFGLRNQRSGMMTVLAMLYAGFVLYAFKAAGNEATSYVALFFIASLARLASTYWLAQYEEPGYEVLRVHRFTFLSFIRSIPHSNFARFVFFAGTMQFSVSIAGPYFVLYMLRDLHFTYLEFSLCIMIQLVAQFLCMQHWGKLGDLFGNKRILEITGIAASLSPIWWLTGSSIWAICLFQLYSGFVWAGYNLSLANYVFDAVSPPKRARCTAYMALITGTFSCLGSLLGSYLIISLPKDFLVGQGISTPSSVYLKVFLLSGIVRLGVALFFLPRFVEVRKVKESRRRDIIFSIVSLRPISGATFNVIGTAFKKTYGKLRG